MGIKKYRLSLTILAIALSSTAIIFSGNAPGVLARSSETGKVSGQFSSGSLLGERASKSDTKASSGLDFSGGDIGTPEQTTGAGTRGCRPKVEKPLVPLMPAKEDPNPSVYNPSKLLFYFPQKTTSDTPSFFFYLPEHNGNTGELAIFDREGNDIYISEFALGDNPGVIKLSLPETVSLEVGKEYQWQLAIICNPDERSGDDYVRGDIQITELSLDLKNQLERESDPIARARLFAQAGIWHDTLELAARARQQEPEAWVDLLASVGLKDFANEPIIECCTLEN